MLIHYYPIRQSVVYVHHVVDCPCSLAEHIFFVHQHGVDPKYIRHAPHPAAFVAERLLYALKYVLFLYERILPREKLIVVDKKLVFDNVVVKLRQSGGGYDNVRLINPAYNVHDKSLGGSSVHNRAVGILPVVRYLHARFSRLSEFVQLSRKILRVKVGQRANVDNVFGFKLFLRLVVHREDVPRNLSRVVVHYREKSLVA